MRIVAALLCLLFVGCGNREAEKKAFVTGCLLGAAGLAAGAQIPSEAVNWESFQTGCAKRFQDYKNGKLVEKDE